MKQALSIYLLRFVIFLAVAAGALHAWHHFHPEHAFTAAWWLLGFFTVVSFGAHVFLLNAEDKRPAVFVRRFMLTTTLRLFLFIMVLAAYSFTHRDTAVLFIIHFLVFYLAFTAFEVIILYRQFRPKN